MNGPLTNFATVNVNGGGSLNGATVNAGTINLAGGSVTGTVANLGPSTRLPSEAAPFPPLSPGRET